MLTLCSENLREYAWHMLHALLLCQTVSVTYYAYDTLHLV
jgi:hypothetical protein